METRFNGKVVPFASAASSGERTIFGDWSTESDDINDNLNADFIAGWENGLEGTLNPYPPSQYFNAALYTTTKLIAYLYQQGIAEWNATQEYKAKSITVGSNGNIYKSTIDNNIGKNPTTDVVNWTLAFDTSAFVKLATNQTIAGIKTFTSFPVTPSSAPTTDYQVANKKYVDDIVPQGLITMWSGSITNIPSGWYLCNGANGTPDLTDRFVIGAGSSYGVGTTGGNKNAVVISHSHSAWTDTQGEHSHSTSAQIGTQGLGGGLNTANPLSIENRVTVNSAGAHAHNVGIGAAGEDGTNKNLPPYYALAYIMKG